MILKEDIGIKLLTKQVADEIYRIKLRIVLGNESALLAPNDYLPYVYQSIDMFSEMDEIYSTEGFNLAELSSRKVAVEIYFYANEKFSPRQKAEIENYLIAIWTDKLPKKARTIEAEPESLQELEALLDNVHSQFAELSEKIAPLASPGALDAVDGVTSSLNELTKKINSFEAMVQTVQERKKISDQQAHKKLTSLVEKFNALDKKIESFSTDSVLVDTDSPEIIDSLTKKMNTFETMVQTVEERKRWAAQHSRANLTELVEKFGTLDEQFKKLTVAAEPVDVDSRETIGELTKKIGAFENMIELLDEQKDAIARLEQDNLSVLTEKFASLDEKISVFSSTAAKTEHRSPELIESLGKRIQNFETTLQALEEQKREAAQRSEKDLSELIAKFEALNVRFDAVTPQNLQTETDFENVLERVTDKITDFETEMNKLEEQKNSIVQHSQKNLTDLINRFEALDIKISELTAADFPDDRALTDVTERLTRKINNFETGVWSFEAQRDMLLQKTQKDAQQFRHRIGQIDTEVGKLLPTVNDTAEVSENIVAGDYTVSFSPEEMMSQEQALNLNNKELKRDLRKALTNFEKSNTLFTKKVRHSQYTRYIYVLNHCLFYFQSLPAEIANNRELFPAQVVVQIRDIPNFLEKLKKKCGNNPTHNPVKLSNKDLLRITFFEKLEAYLSTFYSFNS